MADVFQEVDEMMKQERVEKFWKEYGRWVIAFIVLTILGTAAMSVYKSWNNSVKEKQTGQLIALLDSPDFPAGINEVATDLRPPLRAIAYLSAAQKFQDDDNIASALEAYKTVSNDSAISPEFRDIGSLMVVRLNDTFTPDQKLEKLKTIYQNSNSPWQHHANMEAALIQAHSNNDYAAAREFLKSIETAELAPASMKEKAAKLDHIYSVMIEKNKAEGEG